MQQKMIINVDSPAKLSNLKDGDIVIYDGTRKVFYVTTKESLFYQEQQERIKYQKEMEEHISYMKNKVEECKRECEDLKAKFNDFLLKYQKTNEKVIEMVESVVNGQ